MNTWQKLRWLVLSGITEVIAEEPVNRLSQPTPSATPPPAPTTPPLSEAAATTAIEAKTLSDLYAARAAFEGCPLKKTAGHTLNGRGAPTPQVLCLLEAPDTTDERDGRLLTGEAGALFERMLAAIGLDLETSAYVSTLMPWRPPGNRKPTATEHALCRPFWEREIALLRPRILLLFGAGAAAAVLGISSLAKARGTWHTFAGIPTRVTIPPATLLNLPAQKKQAWEDLQQVQAKLAQPD